MKNLFKNLMLVAVAAMAFTACSEDNNEVNEVAKKTVISGVLNIVNDDTRSGFTGSYTKDEKTYYQSSWDGGETIKIFVDGVDDPVTTTIDKEGRFEVKLDGELPESFYMTIVSPADSWSSKDIPTIPAEQTPLANSVDPKAHLLQAQAVLVSGGVADINMNHKAAYGKMTVNGVDFDIDHVVVNLKGTYYQDYERECTYTINADNVQNNVFWFTTETFENVTEFTVTAYDAEGKAVTKTVDVAAADKTLAFNYGRVSTFSVSLETPEEPATPSFSGAAATGSTYSDFFINFSDKDNKLKTLTLNPCGMASPDWTIAPGTYYFGRSGSIFYEGQYSTYGDTYLYGGTVEISVVNGQYHFEFINLADKQGNVVLAYATYTGEIAGLNVPDLRTPLAAPTNVTATAEANIITIKWDAVEGADGYRVKLYSPYDEYKEEIVTTNEYVYEAKLYNTKYSFTIMSYASDENENKSSDDAYVDVTTGKDPNALADVILSEPTADTYSNHGFCFRMNITDNSGKYFRFFFNEADRVGNNSLNTGVYTGIGNGSNDTYAPGVGKFAATMFDNWGSRVSGFYARHFKEASTIEVTFANNEYTIVLTHEGKTYGYKGMPYGWVAPATGGDQPDPEPDPEPEPDPTPDPDPDQPGDIVVPDGHILLNTCEYKTEIYGMLRQYRFATNDGNNIFYVFVKKDTTHGNYYIKTKTYSNGSMNNTAQSLEMFNMDCTLGSSISDTKIDGTGYGNGITTESSNTMEVISATENGIHEIVFNVKGKAYYFYGTIQ